MAKGLEKNGMPKSPYDTLPDGEAGYAAMLKRQDDNKIKHPRDFMQTCGDCGRFIKRVLWIPKNDTRHPLCGECIDKYDDIYYY